METGTQSSKKVLEGAERAEGVKHPSGGQYTGHGPLAKAYEEGFGKNAWERETEKIPGVKPAKEAGAAISDFIFEGSISKLFGGAGIQVVELVLGGALLLFGLFQIGKSAGIEGPRLPR